MTATDLKAKDIYREQVNYIFRQLPVILWFELVTAILFVSFATITTDNTHSLAYVWLAAAIVLCLLRLGLYLLFSRDSQRLDDPGFLSNLVLATALVSGVIWGSTWMIMPIASMEPPRGAVLLWPCAMMMTAAVNYAAINRMLLAFLLPTLGMHMIVLVAIEGSPQSIQIAIGMAVITGFVWLLSRRMQRDQNRSIKLTLSNTLLQDALYRDQVRIEEQAAELLGRIAREKALLEEKRRADADLAFANEEKLLLLDATGEGIFGTDENGRVTFVNASALEMLGYRENEVIGQDALALLCGSNAKTGKEETTRVAISKCFHSHKPVDGINGLFSGKRDLLLPVKFSCRPILKDGEFIGAVVSFFDMTNQIEMEGKLVQAQKMEAIGRITGGVAHDFNNLLTVIMGNLQFLKRRLSGKVETAEEKLLDKIAEATKRGSELNKRLLSFTREQALKSQPEDLAVLLPELQEFMARILGDEIYLEIGLIPEAMVLIDRAQFENAMLNLCLNARDAMPRGGKVTIDAELFDQGEQHFIRITVTDTGVGIDPEIVDKIFDPFFTTKPAGEGSGLGLSTTYGFVQQSGGSITVTSIPGKGASFVLQFPLVQTLRERKTSMPEVVRAQSYSGTVLVVEDDADILDIARETLLDAGYKVLIASNARAGLEKFRLHPEIDLVFSDIMMPGGINGIEMANEMLSSRPRMQILLATGYTQKILKDRVEEASNIMCISKPYDIEMLPGLINSLMHKAA